MAHYVPLIKETVLALLPQNEHGKKALRISEEIESLRSALKNKSGEVFQRKLKETTEAIQEEKQKCLKDLSRLNGTYYQDPDSTLKKIWDKLVSVLGKLGFQIFGRDQLEKIDDPAKSAYVLAEKKRDDRERQLHLIVATEKASYGLESVLKTQKTDLENHLKTLCGEYFADPKGKLHQAWVASPNGEYLKLEEVRKQTEAELHSIDRQLSIPASNYRSFTWLTEISISEQIVALNKAQEKESELAGIDWKGLTSTAAKTALIAAGYIIIS